MIKMPRKFHSGMMNSLIASGRTEQWSRYMTGGGYTEAVQIGKYKVEIQEDDTDIRFLIWNPARPCITMVLDKREKIAVIDSIEYNPQCNTNGKMGRGEGTREMIDFAISLLKQSGATKVQLMDNSSVVCNGVKVRLGLMYFFRTGQTWYEKYFGFQPEPKYAQRYANAKVSLKPIDKPCDYFTDDIVYDLLADLKLVFLTNIVWELQL
jgi:hypothetical protein